MRAALVLSIAALLACSKKGQEQHVVVARPAPVEAGENAIQPLREEDIESLAHYLASLGQ